jgi:4-amino-4-deoxy-L-arabinose transferase-like glycosyltransferase
MLVSALVFSYASGIVHEYYSVALAPSVAALAAIGTVMLWRRRHEWAGKAGLAAMLAATGLWAFVVLDRSPHWNPWLRFLLVAMAVAAVAGIAAGWLTRRRWAVPVGSVALAAALLGPTAYSVQTVASSHGGALLAAGPPSAQTRLPAGLERAGSRPPTGGGAAAQFGRMRGGSATVSASLVARLEAGAAGYRWVAATTSAPQAAPYELATGKPVMAIGGFMGTDNAISLSAFQQLVRDGKVHYFIGGFSPDNGPDGGPGAERSGGGFRGGSTTDAAQIASWVVAHYPPETVGGTTLYDLSARGSGSGQ